MCDELGGLAPSEANRFYVYVDSGASVSWINSPLAYASATTLPAAFPFPTAIAVERGHLFAVTTP